MNRNRRFVKPANTVIGIEAVAKDTDDCIIVAGKLIGDIKTQDEITIANPSDDDCPVSSVKIVSIADFRNTDGWNENIKWNLYSAENKPVILKIRLNNADFPVKIGSILYGSDLAGTDALNVYKAAIEGGIVRHYGLDVPESDLEKMSVLDCTEAIDQYSAFVINNAKTNEEIDKAVEKINKLKAELVKKLLDSDHIYILHNKNTMEPQMLTTLSQTDKGSFSVKSPRIHVFSEAGKKLFGIKAVDGCVLTRINHDDIKSIISNALYKNGAGALIINYGKTLVAGNLVVPAPEGLNIKAQKLRMWALLRDQADPDTREYHIYNSLVEQSMMAARG